MHGSPLSRYDNRRICDKYNYRDFGITGEPYFDLDFTKVLYLTDTGRRWDGNKVSLRDKISPSPYPPQPLSPNTFYSRPHHRCPQQSSASTNHAHHSPPALDKQPPAVDQRARYAEYEKCGETGDCKIETIYAPQGCYFQIV